MDEHVSLTRKELLDQLVGPRVPRLWCPPLTHYTDDGTLDTVRQATHWAVMRPHVGGFLVPGSTGDGWEMTDEEISALLDATLDLCAALAARVLIGVLKTDVDAMVATIDDVVTRLMFRTGADDLLLAMQQSGVCGFTICPPQGADLTSAEIQAGLEAVLNLDVPLALYQLPQVTENEMSPALVADLAARYPNVLLFKDTSGEDRVPQALGADSDVVLVRGAEGDYAQWLKESGGPYHGLLLSTANNFSAQFEAMITMLEQDRTAEAQARSQALTEVVEAVFALVEDLPEGNAFTNANKAIDHWMAHGTGADADDVAPPMLHAGVRLPPEVIAQTGEILRAAELVPLQGYLHRI